MNVNKPANWWLISSDDVSDIADGLLEIADNEGVKFDVRELASSLLHILDTGTHVTGAVPADRDQLAP